MASIRRLLLASLLFAVSAGPIEGLAHEIPATEGALAAAPAEPEPQPIPISEISARELALNAELEKMEASVSDGEPEGGVAENLPLLLELAESFGSEVNAVLHSAYSLAGLGRLDARGQALLRDVEALDTQVNGWLAEIEAGLEELNKLEALWRLTRDSLRESAAPTELIQKSIGAILEVGRVRGAHRKSLDRAVRLDGRIGRVRQNLAKDVKRVTTTREQVLSRLLVRDVDPIYAVDPKAGRQRDIGDWYVQRGEEIRAYVFRSQGRLLLHLILILGLIWATRRARARVLEAGGEGADSGVLAHPIASALLLGIGATVWIHGTAPSLFIVPLVVAILPPLIIVARAVLLESARPALYGLLVLYVLDRIREILEPFPFEARVLALSEFALAAAGILWLMRRGRLRGPENLQSLPWIGALRAAARLGLVALLISFVAGAAGYMGLGLLLGQATLRGAFAAVLLALLVAIVNDLAPSVVRGSFATRSPMIRNNPQIFEQRIRGLARIVAVGTWVWVFLGMLVLRDPFVGAVGSLLSASLSYGELSVSFGGALAFLATLWLFWVLARMIDFFLNQEVFARVSLPRGVPFALASMTRYSLVVVGFLVALAIAGFDVDRLTILAGALGVGIGFGLQTIVSNFVSGLILITERPIHEGDSVQVGELWGEVRRIGARATVIRTFDGSEVIVPNANLIQQEVVNWTLADRSRRLHLPVGVAYGTDPERVLQILTDVARNHPDVASSPEPNALFRGFGDSSLDFELRAWTPDFDNGLRVLSDLAVATTRAFAEAGITIPFPQRDLHLKSVTPETGEVLKRS